MTASLGEIARVSLTSEEVRCSTGLSDDNPILEPLVQLASSADSPGAFLAEAQPLIERHQDVVGELVRGMLQRLPERQRRLEIHGNIGTDVCESISEGFGWTLEQDEYSIRCIRKESK